MERSSAGRLALASAGAGVALFASVSFLAAQSVQPAQPSPPPSADLQGGRVEPQRGRGGFFEAVGRWVDRSLATVKSGLDVGPGPAAETSEPPVAAAEPPKDAVDAKAAATGSFRIPTTMVVGGRQRCVKAPNGGPDCRAATDNLCRDKGYTGGRSLDIQSAQKCPAWVWLSGRQPAEGDCQLETYVTRAVCQ